MFQGGIPEGTRPGKRDAVPGGEPLPVAARRMPRDVAERFQHLYRSNRFYRAEALKWRAACQLASWIAFGLFWVCAGLSLWILGT